MLIRYLLLIFSYFFKLTFQYKIWLIFVQLKINYYHYGHIKLGRADIYTNVSLFISHHSITFYVFGVL